MRFTIITTSYNSEKTIEQTIKSVLNQSYEDFEYIIIDGGSKDSTCEIIERYISKAGGRLKYITEKDDGMYDAMNKGIAMASGDIIGIINSDDWYEKDTLRIVDEHMVKSICDVVYGAMRTVDEQTNQEISVTIYNHTQIDTVMINHPAVFVRKTVYDRFGLFDLRYKYSADYEFMLRVIRSGQLVFEPEYQILANFRTGGASTRIDAVKEAMKIKKEYGIMNRTQYFASMCFLFGKSFFGYK